SGALWKIRSLEPSPRNAWQPGSERSSRSSVMAFRFEPLKVVQDYGGKKSKLQGRRIQCPEQRPGSCSESVDQHIDDSVRANHFEERKRSAHSAGTAPLPV